MSDTNFKSSSSLSSAATTATTRSDVDTTNTPHHHVNGKTRVRDAAGYRGTIAYIGSVASSSDPSQVYAGIIWDDPDRGKHNGTVVSKSTGQLVSHFACPHATGASFIKINKLDTGTVLTPAALEQRYVALDSDELVAPDNRLPHTAATASGKDNKPIELLGELKIRKYQQVSDLQTLSLRLSGLSSIDILADWTNAQHVRTLDLAGNLFSDWSVLKQILKCLAALENLSLASNRLGDLNSENDDIDDKISTQTTQSYASIQSLNVRDCHICSISTLLVLGRLLPNLAEIGMGQARLTDLSIKHRPDLANALQNLKVLDLSEGQMESHQIVALAGLPCLESLSLDDNPIEEWPKNKILLGFQNLRHLQLAGTKISSWSSLEGLRECPQWQSLRLRSTPLTESTGAAAARSQLIARFASLTVINASPVSSVERQEAERRYVANVTRLLHAKDSDEQSILVAHPTYARLAQEHETVLESIRAEANGRAVGSHSTGWSDNLATVTIRSMAAQSCEQPPLIRRLPATLKIAQVKAILARHFGLDLDLQELRLQNVGDAFPNTVLEPDDESLFAFGVADGASIFMHEVDVKGRQVERMRQQQAQEEKLRQQEMEAQDFINVRKKLANM